MMKDMRMCRAAGIIDESTCRRELDIWKALSMILEGFGTFSDPKGNIKIASKVALGENHGKKSMKEGLTGLRYRITGPNGMDVKHVVGLYSTLGMMISAK